MSIYRYMNKYECICIYITIYICLYEYMYEYMYKVHTISFQTFFVWALLLIVHT